MKRENSIAAVALLVALVGIAPLASGITDIAVNGLVLNYQTEITDLDLSGSFPLPLGPNFSLVDVQLTLSESPSFESRGRAQAFYIGSPPGPSTPAEIADGDPFYVQSFFDVFFDITVTDVDRVNDFHPGFGGSPIVLLHDGDPAKAAHMELGGGANGERSRLADTSMPNFGLFPIEGDVYIGHVNVVIPLPFSVGGDPAENDVLKFQFATHNVGEVSATFLVLPDGTVVEEFDSSAPFEGSIFDESFDPPFGPFTLTGPTTATSLGPQPPPIPEPATMLLGLLGVGSLALQVRRRRA